MDKGKEKLSERNLWQATRDRMARRIKKIQENPSDKLNSSNVFLYKLMQEQAERELANAESESRVPILYATVNPPIRLFCALGLRCYWIEGMADRAPKEYLESYFASVRAKGFPRDSCDRVQISAALGMSGHLPAPDAVTTAQGDCDLMAQAGQAIARHWKVPCFAIDVPYENDLNALKYVEAQLLEIVKQCEKTWPGMAKYDKAHHLEMLRYEHECHEYQQEILDLCEARPCPIAGRDSLRMAPWDLCYESRLPTYYKMMRDDIRERVQQKKGAVTGDEKYRVFWTTSAPFFDDVFGLLESKGCSVPLFEYGPGVPPTYTPFDDEDAIKRFGKKLTSPLEMEAAMLITTHWTGKIERRIARGKELCRKLHIQGIVHFIQEGCINLDNTARLFGDALEKELGVKNLYIDGYCQDLGRYNSSEFRKTLENWLDECIAAEKS